MNDPTELLNRALQAHGGGNLGEAERLYRTLLGADPEQPDALHYLGVIGLQVGRFDEAVELMERAVDARPDYVDAIVNLGNGYNALGRINAAIEQFERARAIAPESATTLANLGGALQQQSRHKEAAKRFEEALALQPDLVDARRSYADSLVKLGRSADAIREINQAIGTGQPSIAMQVTLGNALQSAGRLDDAIHCYESILKLEPQLGEIRRNLGNVLRMSGRYHESLAEYQKVIEQTPDSAEAHSDLALVYQEIGDKQTALEHYRKALDLDPDFAKAWHGVSVVSKEGFTDDEIQKVLDLQNSDDATDDVRVVVGFALGKQFERDGRVDEASEQYLLANSLRRASYDYDFANDRVWFDKMRDFFDESFFRKTEGAGLPDEKPIFIVGMPRSGTTLVEQILASHSRVYGGGELMLLNESIVKMLPVDDSVDYTNALANTSPEQFRALAQRYLDGLPDSAADFVTDKLPHNFLNVGLIRIIFPNAAIIHCRRDPRDTCFSIFKNLFGAHGHVYAYDLEELGHYYLAYEMLMNHWQSVLPGVIHTVDYESMIDSQEETTRALVDACGLEWEDDCLEFHKLKRPVATLSAEQVRQPIYRGSVKAWRAYEKMLAPLLKVLG